MTTFDDREKGYESKFAHDAELQFKTIVRRNKLVGLWAAEKMGLGEEETQAYAKDVVASDFEKEGDEDVVEKITRDFEAKGIAVGADAIRAEMSRLLPIAREQVYKG